MICLVVCICVCVGHDDTDEDICICWQAHCMMFLTAALLAQYLVGQMTLCIRLDSAAGGGTPLPVYQELVKVNSWLHTLDTEHADLGEASHSKA